MVSLKTRKPRMESGEVQSDLVRFLCLDAFPGANHSESVVVGSLHATGMGAIDLTPALALTLVSLGLKGPHKHFYITKGVLVTRHCLYETQCLNGALYVPPVQVPVRLQLHSVQQVVMSTSCRPTIEGCF